jgi:hypothetical protein
VVGESGTSLYLAFDGVCTQGSPYTLQCRVRAMGESDFGDWITLCQNEAFCDTVTGLSLSRASSYAVEIAVLDAFGERGTAHFTISCEDVCFHLKRGGNGAAFGKYAESANTLEIAPDWTLRVHGTLDATRTLYVGGGVSAYLEGAKRVRIRFSTSATFDGTRHVLASEFLETDYRPTQSVRALAVCQGGACGVEFTASGELALTHAIGVTLPATLGFIEGEIAYDLAL